LTYPLSFFQLAFPEPISAPPGIFDSFNPLTVETIALSDEAAFDQYFNENFRNISFGGVYLPADAAAASKIAHESSALRYKGLSLLNLLTNALYNRALTDPSSATDSGMHIEANYKAFAGADFSGIGSAIKWMAFL
jgi:ATP-binding cassette subfamily A (ABC1) protein 3